MKLFVIVLLFLSAAANISASLLLKATAVRTEAGLIALLRSKDAAFLIGSIVFYVIAFGLYALVLKFVPVNRAYAIITVLAQIGLIVGGSFFFGERLNSLAWAGFALILSGIVFLVWSVE